MTAAKPRRLRADAARNRQALIDAAQRLFAVRGLSATLDDIAAEAGVNVATAYRHFANKHELAAAFLQQKIDQAISIAEQAAAADDPWQGLTDFLERMLDLMTANRGLQDVFTPRYANEWFEQLDGRIEPLMRHLLARGQRSGSIRVDLEPGDVGVILQMLFAVGDVATSDEAALRRRYLGLILAALHPTDTSLAGSAPSSAQLREATTSRLAAPAAAAPVRRRRPGRQRPHQDG